MQEDMFPSKVSIYNDNILAGGGTTEEDNFNSEHLCLSTLNT